MFWCLKKLKICITKQLDRNEKKELTNLNSLENFQNTFLIYHRSQRPQKA